ncbi:MAG: hypothetical protein ACBR20_23220 [Microcoleus sp.]
MDTVMPHNPLLSTESAIRFDPIEPYHKTLNAYGWTDIPTDCEFILDYEEEEEESEGISKCQKKKPWRFPLGPITAFSANLLANSPLQKYP